MRPINWYNPSKNPKWADFGPIFGEMRLNRDLINLNLYLEFKQFLDKMRSILNCLSKMKYNCNSMVQCKLS